MEHKEPATDSGASRKKRTVTSFVLLFIFSATYFIAAIINSAEFKHIAGIMVFGLPLAFHLGVLVFVVGLVVTHLHLAQSSGNKGGK